MKNSTKNTAENKIKAEGVGYVILSSPFFSLKHKNLQKILLQCKFVPFEIGIKLDFIWLGGK
ncbi:MAG: hypothetical protein AB7E42_00425 [Anaerotignaceae bacterium]